MQTNLLLRVRRSARAQKIVRFFYSPAYISAVGLTVLFCYTFHLDALGYALLAIAGTVTLLLCDETTPVLPLLLGFPFLQSMEWRENGRVHSTLHYVMYGICGVMLTAALIYHLIVFGGWKRLFCGGKLGAGTVALGAGLLTSGFFFAGYKWINLAVACKLIGPLCIGFFLLRATLRWNRNSIYYLAYTVTVMGLVMSATLAEVYLFNKSFIESGFKGKDVLLTGWGMSNAVGSAIFQGVPLCFFLACKEEKHAWLYLVAAVCMEVCLVFTYSRAALLFSAPLFLVCLVIACVKAKCRKQMWIGTVALCAVGVLLLVALLLREEVREMLQFYLEHGVNDRGRFEIYERGLQFFTEHPVFGTGLRYFKHTNYSYFYHNTIIQFMAAGGLVGIGTYLYYRVQTVHLYLQKLTLVRVFLGLTLAGTLLMGLLDNGVMRLCQQVFMIAVLVFSERDLQYVTWFTDRRALRVGRPLYMR